ncbi:MAG: glycosyltransferase family 4 protein [Candidatus Hydrogenedentes bacterium]|nr:glycosyltransferase family 4 protein [Candidatus Hydrogenedentota bacterium]
MKVLVLTTQFHQLNGAERLGVELAEALNAEAGWKAELGTLYRNDQPGAPEAEAGLSVRGIQDFYYLGLNVRPGPWALILAVIRLRSHLRRRAFDIVETSQITPTILASWASWGLKTAHVAGIHDVFSRERYDTRKHKFWRFSIRGKRCARFYAISSYVARHWIAYSNTPPEKTTLVPNAIPDDCFEALPDREGVRRELGMPPNARIALFVGRMLKRKGIDTVLEGVGPLLEEENLHLAYVGEWGYAPEHFFSGEAMLQQSMLDEIKARGWGARVHFLGRRGDVPRLMASSDVLVHPARIEGFGLVLAEAMAAGLPVVASHVEGIPEVLEGTDSILVPPDDAAAVRDGVLATLTRTPEAAQRAIAKGRERAEGFRLHNRLRALKLLFESAADADGKPAGTKE